MNSENPEVTLAHVPDFYNRYPGETVKFNTCLQMPPAARKFKLEKSTLWVSLPDECELIEFQALDESAVLSASVRTLRSNTYIVWELANLQAKGQQFEFCTHACLLRPDFAQRVNSTAVLRDADGHEIASEGLNVMVKLDGEYINYLPEIYRQDDLMVRFLMLFESFWKPIDRQIRQVSSYFDPDLTPEQFLPWLASWVGAYWDETVPEERRREMLRRAASLYQRRGTRGALQDFLQIFSDDDVRIIERPATNLVLGSSTHLSYKTALGTDNSPDTFSVEMRIQPDRFKLPENLNNKQVKEMMHKKILSIIDAQKPAHTVCKLNLQIAE